MRILVVNDDGPYSPLLLPFLDCLASQPWVTELSFVIPAENQSFKGQSVTYLGRISVSEVTLGAHRGSLVAGTPADCASLGIFNLLPQKPDFVFSGINVGRNTLLPFFLSSGTIGAALMAISSEVRALAFSAEILNSTYRSWTACHYEAFNEHDSRWTLFAELCCQTAERLIAEQYWNEAALFAVNIPWDAHRDSAVKFAYLQPAYFGRMFEKSVGTLFKHGMEPIRIPEETANHGYRSLVADDQALNQQFITLTPIDFKFSPELSEGFAARFSRSQGQT